MHIEILGSGLRTAFVIAALVGLLGIGVAVAFRGRRQSSRLAAAATVLVGLNLLVLGAELLADFLVGMAAPQAVDFNEYRWVMLSSWPRATQLLATLACLLTVLFTGLSARRIHSPWRWAAIVGLRSAACAIALILFLQPAVELRQVAREPNRIAILIDDSRSMELSDTVDGQSRRERARAVIEASDAVLEGWRDEHLIDFYRFSETLVPLGLRLGRSGDAKGKETLLRHALGKVRQRYQSDELAGIVVLSDGVVTGDLAEIGEGEFREFVRELEVPVHTVWAGQEGLRDIAVTEVRADEFAFVRTVTRIEAVIRSTGYDKRRIPVTLSLDGKAMRRKWVELGPGEQSVAVAFEFTPSHVGKYVYKVSVPTEEDEAVPNNNSAWFVLRVIRDKIRVLQVTGQPSWDVRALRGMLKQNPNVDLISFFILRTQEDISNAPNAELSLIPFPTRELFEQELPSFDLVVLQNFNYGPYGMGRYLENIRSYVAGGGGLMMLGGPLSFGSGQYSQTPLAKALPVELPHHLQDSSNLLDTRRFRPKLTKLGSIHPVSALRYEDEDNRALWRALPELEGVNKVLRAKKDASVLAVHPTLKDKSGNAMPVIVAGDYDRGRTLAVTTDSLWRWGFVAAATPGNDGRHYLKFWDNAIRWLIQDPELRYLHVDSDRVSYSPGMTARLNLRLLDQDYAPLQGGTITVKSSRGFDPKEVETLETTTVETNEAGEAHLDLRELPAGVYRIDAEAEVRGRKVVAQDIFLVHEATKEHLKPSADDSVLRMVSHFSSGQFLAGAKRLPADLRFIPPKVVRVDRRSDVALWSQPWLLLCAFAFLALEWLLRQRSGKL